MYTSSTSSQKHVQIRLKWTRDENYDICGYDVSNRAYINSSEYKLKSDHQSILRDLTKQCKVKEK